MGLVPKLNIPNYSEFYELRHFTPGNRKPMWVEFEGEPVPMGADLLFSCATVPGLVLAAEICEDVWVPCPPSIRHACAGATVIANCSASDETVGKDSYRSSLICGQSARLVCGYVYANAGRGSPPRIWCSGATILSRRTAHALGSPNGLATDVFTGIWILEGWSASGGG